MGWTGNWLEHVLDSFFEYSWWLALGWSLSDGGIRGGILLAGCGIVVCDLGELLAKATFQYYRGRHAGRTLDNFTPTDLLIRRFGGRRNVYVWQMLPLALLGLPRAGLGLAFGWAVLTLAVRWWRALRHIRVPLAHRRFDFPVP